MEYDKKDLERQLNELKLKFEQAERAAAEQRQVDEKKHAEEIQFLKRTNQQLKVFTVPAVSSSVWSVYLCVCVLDIDEARRRDTVPQTYQPAAAQRHFNPHWPRDSRFSFILAGTFARLVDVQIAMGRALGTIVYQKAGSSIFENFVKFYCIFNWKCYPTFPAVTETFYSSIAMIRYHTRSHVAAEGQTNLLHRKLLLLTTVWFQCSVNYMPSVVRLRRKKRRNQDTR